MKRKIAAIMLSLMMAASAASCANSDKNGGATQTTTKAVSTTKKTTAEKEETTTASKKKDDKKKTTKKSSKKDSSSDTDSKTEKKTSKVDSKETTITTLSTKETALETLALPDYDTGVKNAESLGWTKDIYDKYKKNKDDQQKFLKSLTLKELQIVLSNYSEADVQEYYNRLHGINIVDQGGGNSVQTEPEVPQTPVDPGVKVDMTVGSDLKKVYDKYNVDLNYLLEITGLTKENFFYLWNNQKDQVFKDNITNLLYGKNYYDNGGAPHTVVNDKIDIQLVKAYWDSDGNLHTLCSLVCGYQGLAYNIKLNNIEVHAGQKYKIAQKQVGALTTPVEVDLSEGVIEQVPGMTYGEEVQLEFIFDRYHVSKAFADIRSSQNIYLVYDCGCEVFYAEVEE